LACTLRNKSALLLLAMASRPSSETARSSSLVITTRTPSRPLQDGLSEAHYAVHHRPAIEPLREWIGDTRAAAVTANLLEIGRSFYKNARKAGAPAPTTAPAMSALHLQFMGKQKKQEVQEWGEDRFTTVSRAAFADMINDTQYDSSAGLLDPFDQFYWEHRMSAWHGASMVERDFYAEPFIPFNARTIFESMLGVPGPDRDSAAVLRRLIETVDPRLFDIPINPKVWPPEPA